MKWLDEKGRLFGTVNVIDLLVIVMVIALACAGGVVLLHHGESVDGATVEKLPMTITVRSQQLQKEVGEAMQNAIGETLLSEGEYLPGATLKNVEIEPYQVLFRNEDGTAEYIVDDRYCEALITLTVEVETDELPVYYLGTQSVYVGAEVWVKTEFVGISGTVLSMEVQK